MLKKVVAIVFAFLILLMIPAGARAQEADGKNAFYISYDKCVAGNEYIFMLLQKGTNVSSITLSSILFIDQYKAASNNMEIVVVFPDETSFEVALGGIFPDGASSPRKIDTVNAMKMAGQLKTIEEEAFLGGTFTHVYLMDNMEKIGSRAFGNCTNLSYIYIPSSVRNIEADAFYGCSGFVIGCQEGSAAWEYALQNGIRYHLVN